MIDLTIPHTVMTTRIQIHMPWMNRRVGPGVYHYAGDMRPRLRTDSDIKHVKRGHVTLEYRVATEDEITRASGSRQEVPAVQAPPDEIDHSTDDITNGGVELDPDDEVFVIADVDEQTGE